MFDGIFAVKQTAYLRGVTAKIEIFSLNCVPEFNLKNATPFHRLQAESPVHYTTSCKHSLVLLRMSPAGNFFGALYHKL